MRIWSISPKYLDRKRLGAAWYEALHCRKVITGEKQGYKNHPQITRISKYEYSLDFINAYLTSIFAEALTRGYKYNIEYLQRYDPSIPQMDVTIQQLQYEFAHIQSKINDSGDPFKYDENMELIKICGLEPGYLFNVVEGDIEKMEVTKEITLTEMNLIFGYGSLQNIT